MSNIKMSNRKFCGNCGAGYEDLTWPRTCNNCGDIAWKNPIPVTFVVQPVWAKDFSRKGLAIAQRARNPGAGEWAFIGGFVDMQDMNLEEAACREFMEETGLELPGKASIVYSRQNDWGQMVIAVAMSKAMTFEEWSHGSVCEENLQLGVMWTLEQVKLCFPIHQKIAEKWFRGEI